MTDTPVTYGRAEVNAIKAQLRRGEKATCPRCEVELVGADLTREVQVLEAYCPSCRHCLFLRRDYLEPMGG